MNYGPEYDVVLLGLRTLFVLGVPVVLALAVAGTIIGALQSATAIQEPALGYAVRLLALVCLLYVLLPTAIPTLIALAELAFR